MVNKKEKEQRCRFLKGLISKSLKRYLSSTFNDQIQYRKLKNSVHLIFCPDSSQFDEEPDHVLEQTVN